MIHTFDALTDSPVCDYPVVLLNGWGISTQCWQSLLPSLQAYTQVIIVEPNEASDLDAICHSIVCDLPEKSIVMGWSLGGMLATHIAAYYPDKVAALMTLATNATFVQTPQWPTAMPADMFDQFYQSYNNNRELTHKRFMRLVVQGDVKSGAQKQYLQMHNTYQAHHINGLKLLKKIDNTQVLANIACPSLHIFGRNDQLVPVATVDKMQALNHQHQYHIVEQAGHLLHMPNERIESLLQKFLTAVVK